MNNSKHSSIIIVRSCKGSIELGETFIISLRILNELGFVKNPKIVLYLQGNCTPEEIEMKYEVTKGDYSIFNASVSLKMIGVYYYALSLKLNERDTWIKINPKDELPCVTNQNFSFWRITVCRKDFSVPEWAKGAIIYHIMVDRFRRAKGVIIDASLPQLKDRTIHENWDELPDWKPDEKGMVKNNDFFCGNLKGIQECLNYLKKLGVTILYLSPIWESQSNHRYDTADYENVDPYAGTNEDLKKLCKAAHLKGMNVILDTVFNHTGNYSKYFNADGRYIDSVGAKQSIESKYYNWYRKMCGMFSYWWGFENLPVMEANNPEWREFLFGIGGVIDKWYSLGIDGLRLDVADELPDDFIEEIRKASKRNKKDCFILGEVWENATTKEKDGKTRKYMLGNGLDSVMNYPYTDAILKFVRFGNWRYLQNIVKEITNDYPVDSALSVMNALSTHDITRAMTTLQGVGIDEYKEWVWDVPCFGDTFANRKWQYINGNLQGKDYKEAKRKFKLATVIQYFLPGNVSIFYGDEVGLNGYKDPFNRKPYPWRHRDKELLKFFRNLGTIRNELDFLKDAEINFIEADNEILIFERANVQIDSTKRVCITLNRTNNSKNIEIPAQYANGKIIFSINSDKNVIGPYGVLIVLA